MVLGSAGEKIQTIVDLAEDVYEKLTKLRDEVDALGETVEDTNDRVGALEDELADQRALLEAVAAENGIDVGEVIADVEDAESPDEDA